MSTYFYNVQGILRRLRMGVRVDEYNLDTMKRLTIRSRSKRGLHTIRIICHYNSTIPLFTILNEYI